MENNCPYCSGFRPQGAETCSHCGKYGPDSLKEILRLTQELEAAEAKGREARNDALEEAAAIEVGKPINSPGPLFTAGFVGGANVLRAQIRALKAPAIGSHGTEKKEKHG